MGFLSFLGETVREELPSKRPRQKTPPTSKKGTSSLGSLVTRVFFKGFLQKTLRVREKGMKRERGRRGERSGWRVGIRAEGGAFRVEESDGQ